MCLAGINAGKTREQIATDLGVSIHVVKRRLSGARKRERLDPHIRQRLEAKGLTDYAGLHSGWLLEKDKEGSGSSLYFHLGPDEEKISFAEALIDVLDKIPRLDEIQRMEDRNPPEDISEFANWIALADLHVGGHYSDPLLEVEFNKTIDHLVTLLPKAKHAVLYELGDILEANDHKGVTPASGNLLDVIRHDHLSNSLLAVKLVRRFLYRLLETHDTVEAHFIKGNHDESAYIAVMIALAEHFADNPRVNIVVSDEEFRVVTWGECAAFPNHGHTMKWPDLKDVFCDQFADEWAAAKAHRIIMTAHYHTDRKIDLVGCVAEHFRTLHRPNKWAKSKGFFARGSLTAMTVHAERGEEHRTIANIRNRIRGA